MGGGCFVSMWNRYLAYAAMHFCLLVYVEHMLANNVLAIAIRKKKTKLDLN